MSEASSGFVALVKLHEVHCQHQLEKQLILF
jgi:hypothetical protein